MGENRGHILACSRFVSLANETPRCSIRAISKQPAKARSAKNTLPFWITPSIIRKRLTSCQNLPAYLPNAISRTAPVESAKCIKFWSWEDKTSTGEINFDKVASGSQTWLGRLCESSDQRKGAYRFTEKHPKQLSLREYRLVKTNNKTAWDRKHSQAMRVRV